MAVKADSCDTGEVAEAFILRTGTEMVQFTTDHLNIPEESKAETTPITEDASGYVFKFKVLKSACLVLVWVCMGLYGGIIGPTLPDFSQRLHVDYDSIGLALAFRSIGVVIGSLACGYLRDRFSGKGDLILGSALSLVALSVGAKPLVQSVEWLAAMYAVEGLGNGGLNAVGNSMCVLMWKKKAGFPVHLIHFGFGVGALIVPLIASPFLSVRKQVNNTEYHRFNTISTNGQTNVTIEPEYILAKPSRIEIPYAIVAIFVLFIGLIYFGFFLYNPFRRLTESLGRRSYKNICDAPFLQDRPCSAVFIILLLAVYNLLSAAIERAMGSFLFTYAVESDIGFTKEEAAYLNTGHFAGISAGRAIMGVLAIKFDVKYLVFIEVYCTCATLAVITFYENERKLIIWVFSCMTSFFQGPMGPSSMAWIDRYVPLYGLVVAAFQVGTATGSFVASWISGYLISTIGPHSLLVFTFTTSCSLCFITVLVQLVGSTRKDRYSAALEQSRVIQDEEDHEV